MFLRMFDHDSRRFDKCSDLQVSFTNFVPKIFRGLLQDLSRILYVVESNGLDIACVLRAPGTPSLVLAQVTHNIFNLLAIADSTRSYTKVFLCAVIFHLKLVHTWPCAKLRSISYKIFEAPKSAVDSFGHQNLFVEVVKNFMFGT